MQFQLLIDKKWKKTELYILYWVSYLLLFTLIEGSTEHDFVYVFRNEFISVVPKALFVLLIIEKLFYELFDRKKFVRFIATYILLAVVFAFLLRLIDNYIVLRYFLTSWAKEPLLSIPPFLYNVIKLQFLLTLPFCFKLYQYFNPEKNLPRQLAEEPLHSEKTSLLVKCERRMMNILFDDIYYFEAQGNYIEIYTINGTFKTYLSISELKQKLPPLKFVRIHRSFVVALNKVESHNRSRVTIGNKEVPIGRSYINNVKNSFSALS